MKVFTRIAFLVLLIVGTAIVLPLSAQDTPSSTPDTPNEPVIDISKLTLMNEKLFDPQHENCAVNGFGFTIDGQAFLISGTNGGLVVDPSAQDVLPSMIGQLAENQFNSSDWGAFMPPTLTMPTLGTKSVALLVIDDFTSNPTLQDLADASIDPALSTIQKNNKLTTPPIPHGLLVYNFINEVLSRAGYALDSGNAQSALWIAPGASKPNLLVMAVNTGGSTTGIIAPKMTTAVGSALDQLEVANPGVTASVIVNMSFAILPCDIVNDAASSGSQNMNDYLLNLSQKNFPLLLQYIQTIDPNLTETEVQTRLGELRTLLDLSLQAYMGAIQNDTQYQLIVDFYRRLIQILVGADPLLTQIQEIKSGCTMFIASAGNDGLPFSYYPGLWPEVLSVSASEQGKSSRATWSNAGETIEKGAWYVLTNPLGLYTGGNAVPVFFKGTSFSAPMVSVLASIKASNAPPCQDNTVIATKFDGLTNGFNDTLSTDALAQIFP